MKAKTSFHCQACGHQAPRWLGRCPDCAGWNTLKEERLPAAPKGRQALQKSAMAVATPISDIEIVGEPGTARGWVSLIACWAAGSYPGPSC